MDKSPGLQPRVGAVVLAAGQSRRMGAPKMTLPWGEHTVIEQVTGVLIECGIDPVVVVTGGAGEQVEALLAGKPVVIARNADYAATEMLESLKRGIRALPEVVDAFLVALGDQPSIQPEVVGDIVARYSETKHALIIPSYQMRRGHPWLIARSLWDEILALSEAQTLRDFLRAHSASIDYLVVDTPTILLDMDTPDDYRNQKPAG